MSRFEQDLDFTKKVKESFKGNSLGKFFVLGGVASSVVNSLFSNPLTGIVESIGIGTSAYILSQSIKSNQELSSMSQDDLTQYINKSAFLAIGGVALGALASILPGPIAHVAHFATSSVTGGGLIGLGTGLYTKIKKNKM